MSMFKVTGIACALAVFSAGAVSAAPTSFPSIGADAPVTTVAMFKKGTAAGMAKQRQRTRTTRCNNMPSRC